MSKSDQALLQDLRHAVYEYAVTGVRCATGPGQVRQFVREAMRARASESILDANWPRDKSDELVDSFASHVFEILKDGALVNLDKEGASRKGYIIEAVKAIVYGMAATGLFELLRLLSIRDPTAQAHTATGIESGGATAAQRSTLAKTWSSFTDGRLEFGALEREVVAVSMHALSGTLLLKQIYRDNLAYCRERLQQLRENGYELPFETALWLDLDAHFSGLDWVEFERSFLEASDFSIGRHNLVGGLVMEYAWRRRTAVGHLFLLRKVLEEPEKTTETYDQHDLETLERLSNFLSQMPEE